MLQQKLLLVVILLLTPLIFQASTQTSSVMPDQGPSPLPSTIYGHVDIVCHRTNTSTIPAPSGLNVSLRDENNTVIASALTGDGVVDDNGYQMVVSNFSGTGYLFVNDVNVTAINVSQGAVLEVNLTVDETVPPSKPGIITATPAYDPQPLINWTPSTDNLGVDHYVVSLYNSSGGLLYNVSTNDTNWSVPASLDDGVYTVYVSAVDLSCNTGPPGVLVFTVDTQPPVVIDVYPSNNSLLNVKDGWVNITVSEELTGVSGIISLDNASLLTSVVDLGGGLYVVSAPVTYTSGDHHIEYTIWDGAGHLVSGVIIVHIDLIYPEITPVSGPFDAWTSAPSVDFTFTLSDTWSGIDDGSIMVYLDGSPVPFSYTPIDSTSGTLDVTVSPDEGWHTLQVQVSDMAGNTGYGSYGFGVDRTPPELVSINPPEGSILDHHYVCFDIVVSDDVSGVDDSSITVTMDGSPAPWTYDPSSGLIEICVYLSDGVHTGFVTLNDYAGNQFVLALNYTVDTGFDEIHIYAPQSGMIYTVSSVPVNVSLYDANGIDTVSFYVDGELYAVYSVGGDTNWSFTGNITLGGGEHVFNVSANDTLGNTDSSTVSFLVDTLPPGAQWITPPVSGMIFNTHYICFELLITDPDSGIDPDSIVIYVDGDLYSGPFDYDTSTHVLTFCLNLSDGTHDIHVDFSDYAGHTGSADTTVIVDTSGPIIIVNWPLPEVGAVMTSGDVVVSATVTDYVAGVNSSSIIVLLNGSKVGFSFDPSSGNLTANLTLSDGVYNVTIVASDNAGNTANASIIFTVDSTPPSISVISPGNNSILGTSNVYIAAFASDAMTGVNASSISLEVNGAAIPFNYTGGLIEAYVNLSEGVYRLDISVSDNAGNTATATIFFAIDLENPTVSLSPGTGLIIPVSSVVLLVNASDDVGVANISVYLDGSLIAFYDAGGSTSFSASINASLLDGQHNLTAVAVDVSGKTGKTTSIFTVDTTPPDTSLSVPAFSSSTSIDASVYAVDDTSGIVYLAVYVNGTLVYEESWDTPLSSVNRTVNLLLGEGVYLVSAEAKDAAGHTGYAESYLTVDTTPPELVITSPLDNAIYNSSTINVSVAAWDNVGLASVSIMLPNSTLIEIPLVNSTNFSLTLTVDLSDGEHAMWASAVDLAGTIYNLSISFTVDTAPPTVYIEYPGDGYIFGTPTIMFSGYVYDDTTFIPPGAISLTVDGVPVDFSYDPGSGSVEATLSLTDGYHTIVLKAEDAAGNEAEDSITILVDMESPSVSLTVPDITNSATVTITVYAEDDLSGLDYVQVYVDGSLVDEESWPTPMPSVSFDVTVDLDEGIHSILVVAKDWAGNTGNASTTVIVDLTPPAFVSAMPPNNSVIDTAGLLGNITITVYLSEAYGISTVQAMIDGTINARVTLEYIGGSFYRVNVSWRPSLLDDSLHFVGIFAWDVAGNVNAWMLRYYTDSTPPMIAMVSPNVPLGSSYVSPNTTLEVEVSAMDNETWITNFSLTVDGVPVNVSFVGNNIWSAQINLTEGSHLLVFTATDAAGHVSTGNLAVIVDLTPPFIANVEPDNLTVMTGQEVNISAQIIESSGFIGNTGILVDGTPVNHTLEMVSGSIFGLFATVDLTPGLHQIDVVVSDQAGHTSSYTMLMIVDLAAPSIDADLQYIVSSPTSTISISVNDDALDAFGLFNITPVVNGPFTVASFDNGTLTLQPSQPLTQYTPVQVQILVSDPAGRIATASFYVVYSEPVTVSWTLEPGNNMVSMPGGVILPALEDALSACGNTSIQVYQGWTLASPSDVMEWPVLMIAYNGGSAACSIDFTGYQLPTPPGLTVGPQPYAPANDTPIGNLLTGDWNLVMVYSYDPDTGMWLTGAATWAGPVGDITVLHPGKGYLVYVWETSLSPPGEAGLQQASTKPQASWILPFAAVALFAPAAFRRNHRKLILASLLILALIAPLTMQLPMSVHAQTATPIATPPNQVMLGNGTASLVFQATYEDSYQSLAALEVVVDGNVSAVNATFLMNGEPQNITSYTRNNSLVFYTDHLQPANGNLTVNLTVHVGDGNATVYWRFTVQPMQQLSPLPPVIREGQTLLYTPPPPPPPGPGPESNQTNQTNQTPGPSPGPSPGPGTGNQTNQTGNVTGGGGGGGIPTSIIATVTVLVVVGVLAYLLYRRRG